MREDELFRAYGDRRGPKMHMRLEERSLLLPMPEDWPGPTTPFGRRLFDPRRVRREPGPLGHGLGPCLVWLGQRNVGGYGTLRTGGWPQMAHRLAYIEAYGEIPDDALVLHRCDNPPCIWPPHLWSGTQVDRAAAAPSETWQEREDRRPVRQQEFRARRRDAIVRAIPHVPHTNAPFVHKLSTLGYAGATHDIHISAERMMTSSSSSTTVEERTVNEGETTRA